MCIAVAMVNIVWLMCRTVPQSQRSIVNTVGFFSIFPGFINLVPRLFSLVLWCHGQKDPGYEDVDSLERILVPRALLTRGQRPGAQPGALGKSKPDTIKTLRMLNSYCSCSTLIVTSALGTRMIRTLFHVFSISFPEPAILGKEREALG
jgi:hypothetical protein